MGESKRETTKQEMIDEIRILIDENAVLKEELKKEKENYFKIDDKFLYVKARECDTLKEKQNLQYELNRISEENARLEKENADLESGNIRLYNDTKDEIWELKTEIERLREKCGEVPKTDIQDYELSDTKDDCLLWNTKYASRIMEELNYKKLVTDLQDQHQQDCIKINQLSVTIDTLVDKYSRLRKTVGMDL